MLGALQAPTGTDLAVHNGAGETLQATHIVGRFTTSGNPGIAIAFVFRAPDHLSEEAVSSAGKVENRQTLNGPEALGALGPLHRVLSLHKFARKGSYYDRTLPASVLVKPATRTKIVGTYQTRVQVEGGYLVTVDVEISARENGQNLVETQDYVLSRVDGWSRSH